jgi:DNA polymerase (family 10)
MISNSDIAKILFEMSALYEMEGVEFKPQAYEKAALGVESLNEDVAEIYQKGGIGALEEIPGVGKGIAKHLEELLRKGSFSEYRLLKRKTPVNITEITAIEGVGPKMVKMLWEKLKIRTLADLEKAARAGKIRRLPRFGERSEKKILQGIEFLRQTDGRQVLGLVQAGIERLEEEIRKIPGVEQAVVAGSVRRKKETIGDVDVLVVSRKPRVVMNRLKRLPQIAHVYGSGMTKTMVKLKNGLDADVRVVPRQSFGAALNYFTGSKAHNIALREIAVKKGWKLNEYGLFKYQKIDTKNKKRSPKTETRELFLAGRTEKELYKALGLCYIEPELRENTGEIEAARKNTLPKLINYGELKGDLQTQTSWTDGEHSIEEMAREAKRIGLEYIAVTDHTKSLAMTGGLDEKKLLKQMGEIDRINRVFSAKGLTFKVLKGSEVNIGKDGSLDIADEVLAKLDVVGAAVHSHFKLSRSEQTKRIIRAMENPHVDIIFHLSGRIINRREPIAIDIEEVIKTAKRTGTILEINAYPERADIKDEYIRKCVDSGVKMAINSDAHSKKHFAFLEFGIAQARRGWATKKDIINTRSLGLFLKQLKRARRIL